MVKHKMHVFLRPLSVACLLLAASCGEDATQQIHGRASTDIVTLNVEEMPVSTSEKARDCSKCRRFSFDLLVGNHAVCGAYVEHLESTVMRHPFCHMKNEKVTGEIIPLEKAGLSDASLAELVANVDAYRRGHIRKDEIAIDPEEVSRFRDWMSGKRGLSVDGWLHFIDLDNDGANEKVFVHLRNGCAFDLDYRQKAGSYVLENDRNKIDLRLTRQYFSRIPEQAVLPRNRYFHAYENTKYFRYREDHYVVNIDPIPVQSKRGTGLEYDVQKVSDTGFQTQCKIAWGRPSAAEENFAKGENDS